MDYKTLVPQPSLKAFVKCYWTLDAPKEVEPERQRIVPDGCMEMIFHHGDLYRQYLADGSSILQPRCFVFGQISKYLEIAPTGTTGIFAVRFYPGGFSPFATLPLTELENRAVALELLFNGEGVQLGKSILDASNLQERVEIIEEFLLKNLHSATVKDRVVRSSVELIMHLNGQVSSNELSGHQNLSTRQFERKFGAAIGLSPKQLSKIVRLQTTLKMLADRQFSSLTAVAYEGDYYDQAHFIKDFKEFTGMTPKQFYAGSLKMSSLFINAE